MEPGSKGKAPVCQGLPHLLTVPARQPEGQHPRLVLPLGGIEALHAGQPGQALPQLAEQAALPPRDGLRP